MRLLNRGAYRDRSTSLKIAFLFFVYLFEDFTSHHFGPALVSRLYFDVWNRFQVHAVRRQKDVGWICWQRLKVWVKPLILSLPNLRFYRSALVPPLLLATSLGLKELTHILRVASEDYVLVIPGRDAVILARIDRELPTIHQEDILHQLVIALRLAPWHVCWLGVPRSAL